MRKTIRAFACLCIAVMLLCCACGRTPSGEGTPSATETNSPQPGASRNPSSPVNIKNRGPYSVPILDMGEDELPLLLDRIFEQSVADGGQSNYVCLLLTLENGDQILMVHHDSEAKWVYGEIWLVDKEYNIKQKKELPRARRCSAGTSFMPGFGCFVVDNTFCVVDETMNWETTSFQGSEDLARPHLGANGEMFLEDKENFKLYKLDSQGKAALIFDNPDRFWFDFQPFDGSDQFRVYASIGSIWRMDSAGNKQIVLSEPYLAEAKLTDNFFGLVRYSSDGQYAYIACSMMETFNAKVFRFEEKDLGKWEAEYGCAVLLRYKAKEDGTLEFDKELYYYDVEADPTVMPTIYAEYREDINGNGYLVNTRGDSTAAREKCEARLITGDGVSDTVAFTYQIPLAGEPDKDRGIRALNEIKLQVLLGFLQLDDQSHVATIMESSINETKITKYEENGVTYTIGDTSGSKRDFIANYSLTTSDERRVITLYMVKQELVALPGIKTDFEEQYPEYRIKVVQFDNLDNLRSTAATELMAGKGPDVIFCYPMPFINPEKTLESGYLLDLTPYIDNNPDFKMNDYYKGAMEAGVIHGKRFLAPLEFDYWPLYTTQNMLPSLQAKAGGAVSVSALQTVLATGTQPSLYTGLGFYSDYAEYLPYFRYLLNMGVPMTDPAAGEALFDQPSFQEAAEFLKSLYKDQGEIPGMEREGMIASGGEMCWNAAALFSIGDLLRWENAAQMAGKKGTVLEPPAAKGNRPAGLIHSALAVNANAKEKEGAIKLVQFALGEESQTQQWRMCGGTPVNKKAMEAQMEYYQDVDFHAEEVTITKEYAMIYLSMLETMGTCQLQDIELEKMVNESVGKYFRDEVSLEQLTNELMRKVELYLKE